MEKYVIPPIFNLDFKFPASFLLLQQLRQVQKSQRLSQPAVAQVRTAKIRNGGRPVCRTAKIRHGRGRPARHAGYRSF